jgi:hypothetical protein
MMLGLDPSDPLNLLIHNSHFGPSAADLSSSASNIDNAHPDWAALSAALLASASASDGHAAMHGGDGHTGSAKHGDLAQAPFDFAFPIDFDVEFDAAMAVDPSALQFSNDPTLSDLPFPTNATSYSSSTPDFSAFGSAPDPQTPLDSAFFGHDQFPFTPLQGHQPAQRRLSQSSAASSSGASLSPAPGHAHASSSPSVASSHTGDSPEDIVARVAQLAGVLSALPGGQAAAQFILGGEFTFLLFLNSIIYVTIQKLHPNCRSRAYALSHRHQPL